MNPGVVFTSVALVGGSALIKEIVTGKGQKIKVVIGSFIYGGFLFLINMASADIAKAMAILVTVSALLVNGPTALSAIQKAI